MSSRATRGPGPRTTGSGVGTDADIAAAGLRDMGAGGTGVAFPDGAGACSAFGAGDAARCFGSPLAISHVRIVSSDTSIPILAKPALSARTGAPAFRSLRSTARKRSRSSALVVRSDWASAMAWESRWASPGSSWEGIGKVLGNRSASSGKSQGARRGSAGENLSARSLDVGVSRRSGGGQC